MSRMRIGAAALALVGSLLAFAPRSAMADRVVIEPRVFVPDVEFQREDGYYRTHDGHYYHYDKDRGGWHYGRNHEEGVRYERAHEHRDHDRDHR